jgi:hypothetical protein
MHDKKIFPTTLAFSTSQAEIRVDYQPQRTCRYQALLRSKTSDEESDDPRTPLISVRGDSPLQVLQMLQHELDEVRVTCDEAMAFVKPLMNK